MKGRLLLFAAVCLLALAMPGTGCASGPGDDVTAWPRASAAERERAIQAVQDALAASDPNGQYEIDPNVRRSENGGFSVIVWRLPKVPDGFTLYLVDADGQVMPYDIALNSPAVASQSK